MANITQAILRKGDSKMKNLLLAGTILAAVGASQARAATQISVENIGSVLNESLALPAEDTPGSSIGFEQFFEFSLPVNESVTLSVSDSGVGNEKIGGGVFSLNTQTSVGAGPLFIPAGTLITSSPLTNFLGGQEAIIGPNFLSAGNYFAELSGTSGSSPIHLVVDGTVTATEAVPEASTWAMMGIGFALMGFVGFRKRTSARLSVLA
jgi:hypothetical protein